MNEISEPYLRRLLQALADGPIGEEILGVARGERDLVVKENPWGAGWIVSTAPKPTELPPIHDWRSANGLDQAQKPGTTVGRTISG